ncbi:ribonuclease HII [Luteolibacter sp. SL250]|uniref:ribonuclease HII n=1 Tax=Luteolibacter sp. SL250 TaxID=2995170 RepID=UPI002271805E|nr:ribonuclease HII [Luteolibacter sp. SL250]WAC18666.1 ribonuclease HII [Luteolibacter sp. SL250]
MPDLSFENRHRKAGRLVIAGIDEAGRGPLAGPVTAAAVVLPARFRCKGLDDSKKLNAQKRREFYRELTGDSRVTWSVGMAEVSEIDSLNILRATHLAMRRAVEGLTAAPDHCLIDGLPVRDFPFAHEGIVKGDSLCLSIAAASVIAKVTRDELMGSLHEEFPQYGFARHQGYGTKDHLEALRIHGPCRHHRFSFQPVAQLPLPFDLR